MGKTEVRAYVDDDVYDEVSRRHEKNGQSKSQALNDLARAGMRSDSSSVASFWSSFGQSLFVVGPVVSLLYSMGPGLGMLIMGLSLMLWGEMLKHLDGEEVGYGEAFRKSIGA